LHLSDINAPQINQVYYSALCIIQFAMLYGMYGTVFIKTDNPAILSTPLTLLRSDLLCCMGSCGFCESAASTALHRKCLGLNFTAHHAIRSKIGRPDEMRGLFSRAIIERI
jgi:hypothetical protein